MIQRFLLFIKQTVTPSISAQLAARSWCVGMFVAWSPFLGLQTILALVLSYLFSLKASITLTASFMINNIWTVIPISLANYNFGLFLFEKILHRAPPKNPAFFAPIELWLQTRLAIPTPSLWPFLIGGTILAFIISCASYPFVKRILLYFSKH